MFWTCDSCGFIVSEFDHVTVCPECGGEMFADGDEDYEGDEPDPLPRLKD